MEMNIRLREQLKILMSAKSLKVTALSRDTGVPVPTIHGWLQGKAPRNIDQVKTVADHLSVTLDWLLYAEDTQRAKTVESRMDEINTGVWEVVLRKPKSTKEGL